MCKPIDWMTTLNNWPCSVGAQRVTDSIKIANIVKLMKHIANQYNGEILTLVSSKFYLESDELTSIELIDDASKQLEEHQQIWETHIGNNRNQIAFELPFYTPNYSYLRYFKIILEDKYVLSNFKNIKKISISYHEASVSIGVVFL